MKKTALKRKYRNKRGASLPMVLAIGLVLAIWTMSLAPIITTQAKTSLDVQQAEGEYLQSRSAIEFTKGELVNMVVKGTPETFAVLKNSSGNYEPCVQFGSTTYSNYVNTDGTPVLDADRNLVNVDSKTLSAICSVTKEPNSRVYNIDITTYNSSEAGMTYHTTYTPPVLSQQVYPESYKKVEALPLSDFILVDGKLGDKTLWYSPLTYVEEGKTTPTYDHTSYINVTSGGSNNGMFQSYMPEYEEKLLPTSENADVGIYPAVFKKPAQAESIEEEEEVVGGQVTGLGSNAKTLTTPPAPTFTVNAELYKQNNKDKIKITITNLSNALTDYTLFAYSDQPNPSSVDWKKCQISGSSYITFDLDKKSEYYIFCYVAGHVEGDEVYTDSPVVCKKVSVSSTTVTTPKFEHKDSYTTLTNGEKYVIYTKNDDTYNYLDVSGNSLTASNTFDAQNFNPSEYCWTVTVTKSGGTNYYKFTHCDGKVLKYDSGYNYGYGPGYGPGYDPGSTAKFYVGDGNASSLLVGSQHIYASYGYNTGYLKFGASNFITTNSSSATTLYFYPLKDFAGGGTQTTETVTVTDTSGSAPKLSEAVTAQNVSYTTEKSFAEIETLYKNHLTSKVSSAQNIGIYLVANGTDGYHVYAVWTKNSMPYFGKLGYITLDMPVIERPAGYGVSGRALYFMGAEAAIDTKDDENVYLAADLLVIRSEIDKGNGAVYLEPYDCGDTLVFFVDGTDDGIFKPYNFYQIPANEDGSPRNLMTATAEQARGWLVCDSSGDCAEGSVVKYNNGRISSIIFPDRVITLETGYAYNYPVINFDIAYASDEQLAHVVSGEAARWTDDGELVDNSGESIDVNGWYVVCPFVTEVGGNVRRSANRIIMKTEVEDLVVSKEIRFVARYLSIDAAKISQDNGNAKFLLYCLTSKENIHETVLSWLSSWLGQIDFSSDTMQVDYERDITIESTANACVIPAQICRYANGTDLFDIDKPEDEKEDLRIEYPVSNINSAFEDGNAEVKIVERYMIITGDASNSELDLYYPALYVFTGSGTLNLYSNYVSFDKNVSRISIPKSTLGNYGDIIINSQETGYTTNEYLYLFTTSAAETYTGTMMYFEDSVDVYKGSSKVLTIPSGFYHVPSGGTSILDLLQYKITTEQLKKETNYINPKDGSFSSAYVNPGFETDETTFGGFGGGSVN